MKNFTNCEENIGPRENVKTETLLSTSNIVSDAAAWQKLDEKIRSHPFLQNYSREKRAAFQHGNFPSDTDKTAYQKMRTDFMNFLVQVLRIEPLILKSIYKNVADSKKKVENFCQGDGYFNYVLESDRDYRTLPARTQLRTQFDGVAYTMAVRECISRYDVNYISLKTGRPASFIGLFSAEYQNCLNKVRQKQTKGTTCISSESLAKIGKISRYLQIRYPNYLNGDLPKSLCQEISDVLDIPPKTLQALLSAMHILNMKSTDSYIDGSGNFIDLQVSSDVEHDICCYSDMGDQDLQNHLDAYAVIQAISSLELKEYNRQLMSNRLLHPIHLETYSSTSSNLQPIHAENISYKNMLRRYHAQLANNVWDFQYLNFVGWKSEKGEDGNAENINVLCDYYPVLPLLDQTIARYRHVTAANVTYYAKKFEMVRNKIKALVNG